MRSIYILLILVMCGCASPPLMNVDENKPYSISKGRVKDSVLIGDTLKVESQGDTELSGTFTVQDDGSIVFPYIEKVIVVGKTADEVSFLIKEKLMKDNTLNKDYILDLKISTQVVESKTKTNRNEVKVVGEVKNSSAFPYWEGMRVLDAITKAGGTVFESHLNQTILYRKVDREDKMYGIYLKDIYRGDMTTNYYLQPGDAVIVPRDPLPINTTIDVSAVLTLFGLAGI